MRLTHGTYRCRRGFDLRLTGSEIGVADSSCQIDGHPLQSIGLSSFFRQIRMQFHVWEVRLNCLKLKFEEWLSRIHCNVPWLVRWCFFNVCRAMQEFLVEWFFAVPDMKTSKELLASEDASGRCERLPGFRWFHEAAGVNMKTHQSLLAKSRRTESNDCN